MSNNHPNNRKHVAKSEKMEKKGNHQKEGDAENRSKKKLFTPYLSMTELKNGLKCGQLIKGALRINQKNYEDAYIDNPDEPLDILIKGLDRNRALHSDIVAVRLKTAQEQKKGDCSQSEAPSYINENVQKLGEVVGIIERRHTRVAVGQLKPLQDGNPNWALFSPNDSRIPRMRIPSHEWPDGFALRPRDFAKTLFVARIVEWPDASVFAKGTLCKCLGQAGDIEAETEGILYQFGFDATDFSNDVLSCLPVIKPGTKWTIPKTEYDTRSDFREYCVFSIDPSTAKDLDDALHIRATEDGLYEVGVHIADVSYFVQEDSALDQAALRRATTVYLVQKAIPMLPNLLCEELCSLNPGVDRLTFSIVWKLDLSGQLYGEWIGRSIIRSCCKLSYETAQGFLDEPERHWKTSELPQIYGNRTPHDIAENVRLLNEIACSLRRLRIESGALRLDQPKLSFMLNKESNLPVACNIYEPKASNGLVEEFMLLANMASARRIKTFYPDKAVLRRHPSPKLKPLKEAVDLCASIGYPINATSSGTLQASLERYRSCRNENTDAMLSVLVQLLSKPMQLAQYFCTGAVEHEVLFRHYALNVPYYCHFTSPIRRYPDIMVHRLLAASIGQCEPTDKTVALIQKIADHCNDQKLAARSAGDMSVDLYFNIFLQSCGSIQEKAVVMGVMDHSLDVLIFRYGIIKRVYCNKLDLLAFEFDGDARPKILTLKWAPGGRLQSLQVFDRVDVILRCGDELMKPLTVLVPPRDEP